MFLNLSLRKNYSNTVVTSNTFSRNLFLSAILLLTFSSCLTPKKIDSWIGSHYQDGFTPQVKNNRSYISIKTTEPLSNDGNVSTTEKGQSSMLPLLFYFQWKYTHVSTLNQAIPLNNLGASILSYGNSKGLQQKLNGQTLELTVKSVPHIFSLVDKGWMVWIILGHFGMESIYLDPEKDNLVVSYRVLQGVNETKSGTISLTNTDKAYHEKVFQSMKKMTSKYLDQYDESIKGMSQSFVDKLLLEL